MVVIEDKPFLSGVIEGFYGRPWTCKQRNELFQRTKKLGMNAYVYAPKDDVKHRALWRQLYTSEEEGKLATLISAAESAGVSFVYAISPGLDIVFSCAADVAALKRKMKQVSKLGCKSFAILFDDIDPRLKQPDSNIYKSSGDAQALLANELFHYLKEPRFLFCPTEYCKTRAFPTIDKSEYLNTIGMNLNPEIDILWTGDKVISQVITTESIIELSKVLRRKPVIWDNIHANDYDHRRVFLGPYCGRPVQLYKYLNGVLTNPNCEFEANYLPIHTFATWCHVASLAAKPACNGVTENSMDSCELNDVPMEDQVDDNMVAHENQEPVEIDLYPLTPADVNSVFATYDPKNALKLAIQDWITEFNTVKAVEVRSYAKRHNTASVFNGQTVYTGNYGLDITNGQDEMMVDDGRLDKSSQITSEDLALLVDLFHLPYEHGERGKALLGEFKWLKENSHQAHSQSQLFNEKETSWKVKAAHFHSHCHMVAELFMKLSKIPNESILYDLYPYVWDANEAVLALDSYVSWLASSEHKQAFVQDDFIEEPAAVDIRAAGFQPEDFIEAWHVKYIGGIVMAMHRLLPFDGGYNFLDIAPDSPSSDVYHVRPFHETDKENLYKLCSIMEATTEVLDIGHEDFHGDKRIGAYLDICAKSVFVVEHNSEICGYVAAAPNNKSFNDKAQSGWYPFLNTKYQKSLSIASAFTRPTDWYSENNSHLEIHMEPKIRTARVMRRVLAMVLSVLKSLGSAAVFLELKDEQELDMYSKLGFNPVNPSESKIVLTRAL